MKFVGTNDFFEGVSGKKLKCLSKFEAKCSMCGKMRKAAGGEIVFYGKGKRDYFFQCCKISRKDVA